MAPLEREMIIKDNNMCPFSLKYRKIRTTMGKVETESPLAKYLSVVENIPNGHITVRLSVQAEDDGVGSVNMV